MDNQLSGSTCPPFTGQLEFEMLVFADGGKLKDPEKNLMTGENSTAPPLCHSCKETLNAWTMTINFYQASFTKISYTNRQMPGI